MPLAIFRAQCTAAQTRGDGGGGDSGGDGGDDGGGGGRRQGRGVGGACADVASDGEPSVGALRADVAVQEWIDAG